MKIHLPLTAALLIAVQPACAETGTELLDKLIAAPGSYSQVCSFLTTTEDIPFKAFQIQDYSGAYFSDSNIALMKSRREEVVAAVRRRLGEIDLTREPVLPKPDITANPADHETGNRYGADPESLNSFLLEIIKQTDAIEALPELLVLEEKLVKGIDKVRIEGAPPKVSGWSSIVFSKRDEPQAAREHRGSLNSARIAQRDLVALIALLMRERKYEPYLVTDFEKAYVQGLRKAEKEFNLSAPDKTDDLSIETDPVSGIRHYDYVEVEIPYSKAIRDSVRAAAEKWISEH